MSVWNGFECATHHCPIDSWEGMRTVGECRDGGELVQRYSRYVTQSDQSQKPCDHGKGD